jgi:16S rRNA (guanine(966)-N(2))-methyltransferase RsmD
MAAPGVRVSGGVHRGRRLEVPASARPTSGRLREALLSIWGEELPGCRFLDLFAGSGVMGLEASGRGALSVLAVEGNPRALKVLERNRASLGETIDLRRLKLPEGLGRLVQEGAGPFDLIFADPPYANTGHEKLLMAISPLLAPQGELGLEHSSRHLAPDRAGGLIRVDTRRYGESCLSRYRHGPA